MSPVHALALVESPAQLLNVVELGQTDPECTAVPIVVLPPADGPGRGQLRAMTSLAREAGHPVTWHEPRLGGASVARSVRAMAGELSGVDHLVIGDPFSGLIQVIISVTRPASVTVVDDGTATLEFARQFAAGEHLTRWHAAAAPGQRRQIASLARNQIAGNARRWISPVSGCRLRVFTSMEVELARVEVLRNDYSWVRSLPTPEVLPGADLIGTSLVESGVLTPEAYLGAVADLAGRYDAGRYFAHRREQEDKLDDVRRLGLEVVRPQLPLELVARQGPVAQTLVSFPSTVVHTLPTVLSDTAVDVVVCDIAEGWYARQASVGADAFLGQVSATARRRHGLRAVAS
ncbi:MAG: hypothetical protein JWP61_1356 [Friedmanniella sp.]|nr:hypothetical protein [Friedmanniella sp.]